MQEQYAVEMLNIDKAFGGIHALKDVSFKVKKGEVHALVGENGAGKSTLMKILSGAYKRDRGEILMQGSPVNIANSHEGKKAGISIIYQEFALASELTVAENIFMGEDVSMKKPLINWKNLYKKANESLLRIGFNINPKEKVKNLSVAYQQMTEIAKALIQDAKVLILDEPTAVLGPQEAEKLFDVIKKLKNDGVSIIYISHRLEEIFRISDSISVLKDGEMMGMFDTGHTNMQEIITKMIGREMGEMFPPKLGLSGEPILTVENIKSDDVVKGVSFTVNKGEVLGIAGLVGAGKTETMRLIFGADRKSSGEIYLNEKLLNIRSPRQAVKYGISYVPENRKEHGILLKMSTRVNSTLANLSEFTRFFGIINNKKEIKRVYEMIDRLEIKVQSPETLVEDLSGGNQQKVSLSKWIALDSKVIILDEPTRGVDVGAKVEIYKIIQELTKLGIAIVFISSEMMEIIGMSDRVIVMHEGKISGELDRDDLTEEKIMTLAVGQVN